MSVYKSGAFIQQCFSVHPRCLTLQKFTPPELAFFTCTSCRLTHRVTIRALTMRVPVKLASEGRAQSEERVSDLLTGCLSAHAMALSVCEMDVVNDRLGMRCADCRRFFDFEVASFETRERT